MAAATSTNSAATAAAAVLAAAGPKLVTRGLARDVAQALQISSGDDI